MAFLCRAAGNEGAGAAEKREGPIVELAIRTHTHVRAHVVTSGRLESLLFELRILIHEQLSLHLKIFH